jgi:hypothetical protein
VVIQFRPTRNEISRAFPVLGFTIRTGGDATTCEIALATHPGLLPVSGRERRTPLTFWSSRPHGRIEAPRGESVYIVPPDVLARFAGQERLYYAVAVYRDSDPGRPEIVLPPENAAPYVAISKSFTGRSRRLSTAGRSPSQGYGQSTTPDLLSWAADEAAPGSLEPVLVGQPPAQAAGGTAGASAGGSAAVSAGGVGTAAPVASQGLELATAYSDGLGDKFWEELAAEVDDLDAGDLGPVPDEEPGFAGTSASEPVPTAAGLDAPTPEDPFASRFVPANAGNYRVASGRTISRVVIHITDGGAKTSGPVSWFQNPDAKVSAHYVIGQDGEIVQMVRHGDVAWHAGSANGDSIGIEHVANTRGLTPTEVEYQQSARLVRWLCDHYAIPCDRQHVLGHAEADSRTTHRGCPNAVWDWDHYMGLVSGAGVVATPDAAQALEGSMDLYYDDVELVPQPTSMSCWAAAVTMVYGWTKRISLSPQTIAQECQRIEQLQSGLPWSQRDDLASQLGLTFVWPQSYTVQGFYNLLHDNGPLYIGRAVPTGHAVCVIGLHGDGTPDGTTVIFHDPWPPGVGTANSRLPFTQFMSEYEAAAAGDAQTPAYPQIIHGNNRRQAASLALGLGGGATLPAYAPTGYQPGYGSAGPNGSQPSAPGGTATLVRATEGAVAAIGGAVVGAAISAVAGNNGDVTWNLQQFGGPHHPGGNPANAGTQAYRRSGPITIRSPRGSTGTFAGADEIYADFDVTWEQNGRSVGNVTIAPTPGGSNDAAGAALDVRTTITPMMTELPGPATNPSQTLAGVLVQFQYAYSYSWAGNTTGVVDLELHGDGTYTQNNRW